MSITMATAPSGLLCPPSPSPFRFRVPFQFRVLCLRRAAGRGLPGGVVSGGVVPGGGRLRGEGSLQRASLARARRSHGERRAALAGPVHSPGHQLCGHSLPVFRVPAEGPGRPGAQGQCPSPPGLSRPCRPGGTVSPPTCRGPLHPREKTPQRNQARTASPGPQEPGSEFGSRDNGFPSSFLPSSSRCSE